MHCCQFHILELSAKNRPTLCKIGSYVKSIAIFVMENVKNLEAKTRKFLLSGAYYMPYIFFGEQGNRGTNEPEHFFCEAKICTPNVPLIRQGGICKGPAKKGEQKGNNFEASLKN